LSQEEFYNLQSKHRGKKTFNFYDKFVPQPFKITPSVTPSITPTTTPSITPTPSASLPPCTLYQSFCFYASDGLSYINGIYNRIPGKSGAVTLTNISGTTYEGEIDCSSNYAIYTGTTAASTTGVWMFDTNGDFLHFELLSGNFACTPFLFEVKYQLVEYPTPTTFTCDGIIYPDQSDLQGYITYGGVCPTPTPSATLTPTPSITPSEVPLPNDSYVEVDQFFTTPTSYSYGCFSLSGTGYIERISISEYQFVEGTHPDGNNYSFYVKNLSADTVALCWMTTDRFEPKTWEWATINIPNKTSTGWTDGETFPSLNSQRTTPYTDNTTTNGYHYPSRSGVDYYCGSIPPSATPGLTPTPTPSSVYQNGFKLTNTNLGMDGTYVLANTGFYDQFRGSSAGQFYTGWVCINPATFIPPYGNLYKNINDDDKFVNVESFNGGNVVRLYSGSLTSQIPSDPNNPFSCNTRLFDSSRDFGYNFTGSATTYCSLSFPVSGSTTFGDVEYLPCI